MQTCSVCELEKPLTDFHRDKNKARGVSSTCKVCANERARLWVFKNPDRAKASRAANYAVNRDDRIARMKVNRRENSDRYGATARLWAEANKERKASSDLAWQRANPEKMRLYRRVSEARRRSTEGHHTSADIEKIRKQQRGRCAICRNKLQSNFEIDHIVPLARGGTNWPHNIQLACEPCNIRKHARDPIDHMRSLGRLL